MTRLRQTVIAGNWKMNKTPGEASAFVGRLKELISPPEHIDVVLCVPFVDLPAVLDAAAGSPLKVGAQNMHYENSGAFTGEVSVGMLSSMGVTHVIIGHSERRQYFGETDETVNKKLIAALEAGLTPILCVGENLSQRQRGVTAEVLALQTKLAFSGVSARNTEDVVIAYEPIWAIGTGVTATAKQANEGNHVIRQTLISLYGGGVAQAVTIQYGGSMNAKNAAELLSQNNVNGGLIGGASLQEHEFALIVKTAMNL